jgi:hypothetical protein
VWFDYQARGPLGEVIVVQADYEIVIVGPSAARQIVRGAVRELRTQDGRPLRLIYRPVYQLPTGETLRATDPNAP